MKKSEKTIPVRVSKGNISVLNRLKVLNKAQRHAVLATDSGGQPYTSLIAYALTPDLKRVIFATPRSTRKYRNILKNKRVSLLIDTRSNTNKDYMSAESITIVGNAKPVRRGKSYSEMSKVLMEKHPKLTGFTTSPETSLIVVDIIHCIHVTRFQSVSKWNVR